MSAQGAQTAQGTGAAPATPQREAVSPLRGARAVATIAAREFGAYFDSSIAYVYTIGSCVLANSIFMNEFFLAGTLDMRPYFELMPLLLAFFLPAVTMRLWAEERRLRTIELLLTLPIVPAQAVLAKFLAALALFGTFVLGSAPIALMLALLGEPDWGTIAAGYLGLALLAALFLALGAFLSALSSDQIVAFVFGTIACLLLVLSGEERVVAVLDGLFPRFAPGTFLYENASVRPHYDAFVAGRVGLAGALYFAGSSAVFLALNALVLARNRG